MVGEIGSEFLSSANPNSLTPMGDASTMAGLMLIFFLFMLLMIGFYIYFSLALMKVAKRTNTEPAWLAWIPVCNMFLMSKIAKMHWWPLLLLPVSFLFMIIGSVFTAFSAVSLGLFLIMLGTVTAVVMGAYVLVWQWKICMARNKPGWWALLSMISLGIYLPVVPLNWVLYFGGIAWSFIMWGVLAWSKD